VPPHTQEDESLRRNLPQLQKLLELPAAAALCDTFGRSSLVNVLRENLATLREQIGAGVLDEVPEGSRILANAGAKLAARRRPGLRAAINATGIVLHTNLGRASGGFWLLQPRI
jgi:L-seryl-tRNA(Ser) seleniumtransferase